MENTAADKERARRREASPTRGAIPAADTLAARERLLRHNDPRRSQPAPRPAAAWAPAWKQRQPEIQDPRSHQRRLSGARWRAASVPALPAARAHQFLLARVRRE